MRQMGKAQMVIPLLCLIIFHSVAQPQDEQLIEALVKGNSAFALTLYRKLLARQENLFFSPSSISTALAMTYAGARGETERGMAKTLQFPLAQDKVHTAFGALRERTREVQGSGSVTLREANSLWLQEEFKPLNSYLTLLKDNYGVTISTVNFKTATESARGTINLWVEDKTNDKIKELLKPGSVGPTTASVLVNAIYFKGNWDKPFSAKATSALPFHVSASETKSAPMMYQKARFPYLEEDSVQVIELPYGGEELSMLIFLPKEVTGLKDFEESLSLDTLNRWRDALEEKEVKVFVPKFSTTAEFRLKETLSDLGMPSAFDSRASFAGITGPKNGFAIGDVIHKAFVDLNEEGTEAAAATGVIMERAMAMNTPIFKADHPFVFLIQDNKTGSILFLGRIADPAA